MILCENTPNMAGITVSGDSFDLEQLYNAIHHVLPGEGEDIAYDAARMRVLGFCYDIRHAMAGHREFKFVDNGLDSTTMKELEVVGNQKNLYFSFPTYYPEMIFLLMAITLFVEGKGVNELSDNYKSVQTIKNFRSSVFDCLKETLSSQKYLNTVRSINRGRNGLSYYMFQYIDYLNLRFLEWDKEKREKNISIIAKRIQENGAEYQKLEQEIYTAASKHDCHPEQIRLNEEYPEFIDW